MSSDYITYRHRIETRDKIEARDLETRNKIDINTQHMWPTKGGFEDIKHIFYPSKCGYNHTDPDLITEFLKNKNYSY